MHFLIHRLADGQNTKRQRETVGFGCLKMRSGVSYFESPGEGYLGYHWILYDTVSHRIQVW